MPAEPFHRLFFALRPPAAAVPLIGELRGAVGQARSVVADANLHLTTWLFADTQEFPVERATTARAVVDRLPLPAFRVALDRMVGGKGHVVLVPSEPLPGYDAMQAILDDALRTAGLVPRPGWRFRPHMTLVHGRYDIDRWIDAISWTADALFLIDSVVGRRRHDVVARWPLPHLP